MFIIGCDFHSRFQQIAMLDPATGEVIKRRLEHENGEAQKFYATLPSPARVGMEATCDAQWFERGSETRRRSAPPWCGSRRQTRAMPYIFSTCCSRIVTTSWISGVPVTSRWVSHSRSPYLALRSFIPSIFRTVPETRSPRARSCSVMWRPKPLFTPVINQFRCVIFPVLLYLLQSSSCSLHRASASSEEHRNRRRVCLSQ